MCVCVYACMHVKTENAEHCDEDLCECVCVCVCMYACMHVKTEKAEHCDEERR